MRTRSVFATAALAATALLGGASAASADVGPISDEVGPAVDVLPGEVSGVADQSGTLPIPHEVPSDLLPAGIGGDMITDPSAGKTLTDSVESAIAG